MIKMKLINRTFVFIVVALLMVACSSAAPEPPPATPQPEGQDTQTDAPTAVSSTGDLTIKGEVWADNWFAFYLGEQLIKEDSVSITTERSFNAETFEFNATYPLTLNIIAKDFKENDTGLEYIGQNNQQMGDGGLIAQFTNTATGEIVAVTNSDWECLVIHEAPLDKACANESNPVAGAGACGFTALDEPTDWKTTSFDDAAWTNAIAYSEQAVRPKDGYDEIAWDDTAQLIWTADLETHNTLLCRLTVAMP